MKRFLILLQFCISCLTAAGQNPVDMVRWPEGKRMALSLTFDDARLSQVDVGMALLDEFGVKATFFVVPSAVRQRLSGWRKAVASGHEIGNHSLSHPCSGNFNWSRNNALENYSLDQIKRQLLQANDSIQHLLNVSPQVFAYPCGQKFVGRGMATESYVPVVSENFILGRGWLDEAPNDPAYCDFAQITGMEMDGKTFEQILPLIESSSKSGKWLVLAGHEMGNSGSQTTRLSMLRELIQYASDPVHGIWLAPAGEVARYIRQQRR